MKNVSDNHLILDKNLDQMLQFSLGVALCPYVTATLIAINGAQTCQPVRLKIQKIQFFLNV